MYNLNTFLILAKNSICGLKKGTEKVMYIEHNFENAHLKLAKGKPIKKFPKRGQSMKINICGHVMVRKFLNHYYEENFSIIIKTGGARAFCAPFALPETNACKLGKPISKHLYLL